MDDDGQLVQIEHGQRFLWKGAGGATTSAGNVGGTTLIDTARTEAADYWNDRYDIVILEGANQGEVRQITGFNAGTDTITVSPAFTAQVDTGIAYIIRKIPSSLQGANNADNVVETDLVVGNIDGSQVERMESVIKAIQIVAAAGTGFEEDGSGATLYNTLISVEGATDGAGTTATIVDSARTEGADYWNGTTIVMLAGSAAGQTRTIVDDDGAGTLTVEPVLGAASGTGNAYVILNQKGTDWIIGDNNANNAYDSSTVTANDDGSVLERLEFLQTVVVVGEGTFTTSSATVPADTSQGAKADDWFSGCILLPTAGSVAYQPRLIVGFTTTTGVFTIDSEHPFTAATGTETYVVLSNEADLVPAADSTATTTTAHVVGNKADTIPAMNAAPNNTDSLIRLCKALLERVGATPNDPDDSLHTITGQRDDAATNDDMSDITTTSIVAKLRLILNRMSTDAFTATIQGAARTALDTMLAQLATYLTAAGAAMSIQQNNQTARTNLEQVWEDWVATVGTDGTNTITNINNSANTTFDAVWQQFAALWGADGANVFNPTIDGTARTTLKAALEALAGLIEEIGGMSRFGTVSTATDTQNFKIAELTGYGDDFFNTDWVCTCIHNADNDGNAPEGESVDVTDYVSSDGSFVTAAFTVAPTVGDEMMLVRRELMVIDSVPLKTTPITNSLAYRLSQYLASGDGDWAGGTALPSNNSLFDNIAGTNGIATWPAAADIGNGVSLAEGVRAILTSMVGGDDYDAYTNISNSANASLDAIFQKFATLFAADGANIFNPTIQGAARTDLELALAALATYMSASGAAWSVQVNNQAARDNLEQVWEDYLAVIGCDATNVFDPAMFGGSQTTVEAAFTAMSTALGAEFDGSPDLYDVTVTGYDSSAITENTDGSIMEMLKALLNKEGLAGLAILADQDMFDVADADANNERWDAGYVNGTEGGSADISTTTAGKLMVKVDPDATPTAAMYAVYNSQPVTSKYATWIVDLDSTITGTVGSQQSTGMEISEATYSANDRVYIQKQIGAAGERITTGALFNGANQGETHYVTTDDAIALKIERRDNVWRTYYSLAQSPDFAWVMLSEFEDANEDIASETECYLEAYSPGDNDDQISQGDFDNWKLYIGFKGIEQILAGDFDSAHVSANEDGSLAERLEQIQEAINKGTGSALPANKSIYDTLGAVYVDGGGGWNTENLADDIARIGQYLIDGTAGNEAGSTLPAAKSLVDLIGSSYVDGGGGFNLENVRDDLRTLATRLIDGTAGAEAGATLPAGKSIVNVIGTSYLDGGGAWNADSISDDFNRLGQYLIDGTAGNEAGTTLPAGKSMVDIVSGGDYSDGSGKPEDNNLRDHIYRTGGFGGAQADKTYTFSNTAAGSYALFTVTGDVVVRVIPVCTTDLTSAAAASVSLGTTTDDEAMIADTLATAIIAREIWHDTIPDSEIEALSVSRDYIITDGNDIRIDLTAQIDTGAIIFYCIWTPLSSDGDVVPT